MLSGRIAGIYTDELNEDHAIDKQKIISMCNRNFAPQLKPAHQGISDSGKGQNRFQGKGSDKWPTSWSQQFYVLLRRDIKERRHESFWICQVLVVALISGLLWYKSDNSHLQDQVKVSEDLVFMSD